MRVAALVCLGAHALLREKLDPTCSKGIINTEMTACCQADCGACEDGSDVCLAAAKNGRGSTCCPSTMLNNADLPSCDNSHAPCKVPAHVRAKPTIDELTAADRVAGDDCNNAVPDEVKRQKKATHFLHFPEKDVTRTGVSTTGCGSYGCINAAIAKCDNTDDCMAVTTNAAGNPDCLVIAGTSVEHIQAGGSGVYLKVKDVAGNGFHFSPKPFTECSKRCGGGESTRELECMGSNGLHVPLGMCSSQVAMNADALPATEIQCNVFECEGPCKDGEFVQFHFVTGGWPYEMGFTVQGAKLAPPADDPGKGMAACQGSSQGAACCVPKGTSDVSCTDSYGDGWNGGQMFKGEDEICAGFDSGDLRSGSVQVE